MLVYTPESKEMVHNVLHAASDWGKYGERFIAELHKKLSLIHLREDGILITHVEFKSEPIREEMRVKFYCEFSLKWENRHGVVGGLVWNETTQTFGIHT
jgi:hypothetical protein